MKNKMILAKCLRLIVVTAILVWGVKVWDQLPENVVLEFNTAMLPKKHGSKYIWSSNFLYMYAAYIPFRPLKTEGCDLEKEEKKAVLLSWVHSTIMCTIFVVTLLLVKKNLTL